MSLPCSMTMAPFSTATSPSPPNFASFQPLSDLPSKRLFQAGAFLASPPAFCEAVSSNPSATSNTVPAMVVILVIMGCPHCRLARVTSSRAGLSFGNTWLSAILVSYVSLCRAKKNLLRQHNFETSPQVQPMTNTPLSIEPLDMVFDSAQSLYDDSLQKIYRRTDRLFAWLLGLEWLAGILAALWISPLTWAGTAYETHAHVWAALLLGGIIIALPVSLAAFRPGNILTRHTIAVAQMLMGALFIHLAGGRIETHFHVFGSLAFWAFYRDWWVLISATLVVAVDHFLRGLLWPQSVYGIIAGGEWRWLEHAGWVLFEDLFLIYAC